MNEQERIDFLFDCAQKLFDESEKQQNNINQLLSNTQTNQQSLNRAINRLNTIFENIEDNIIKKVDYRSREISNDITKNILEEFKEANQYAKDVTEKYKKAAKWSIYQPFLLAILFFSLFSIVILFITKEYVLDDINVSIVKCNKGNELRRCLQLDEKNYNKENGLYLLNY